ncbi:MAG TPA: esterase-like activity of phytase family protein [Flavisolibacter sp.]|nr:esterase-like activity of phytase family protein [Flavisolibacter sp.]
MHKTLIPVFISFLLLTIVSCSSSRINVPTSVQRLRFLGEYTIPAEIFDGTKIGGLSGIDYDASRKHYYLICDDRADTSFLRYYTAKISLDNKGITSAEITAVTKLLKKDGQPFHNRKQNPFDVPDPEAIRFHPPSGTIFWSSEGERIVRNGTTVLTNPAIFVSNRNGQWIDTFPLPPNMRMSPEAKGPRNNGAFEGIGFSPDYRKLFVSMEEPLYDDGPRAGLYDSAGWVRIIQYDVATKTPEAQFAYPIDPVVQEPISQSLFIVNGITDVLPINDHQLLVTERSFSTGRLGNNIRVYLVELAEAQDVSNVPSIRPATQIKPVLKTLLLNMDRLGRLIDNIEGATFGPRLPNGKQSLLFVADNNFSSSQKNQLLLFEVE